MNDSPIIVCGMARSGTGLVTRFLQKLGVFMGGRSITINGEALAFKEFNRQILDGFGCTWRNIDTLPTLHQLTAHCDWIVNHHRDPMFEAVLNQNFFEGETYDLWGWKDPRSSLVLPLWKRIFPNAQLIHVCRNSTDVARSNVVNDWSREDFNSHYHNNGEKREWFDRYRTLNDFYLSRINACLDLFDVYYCIDYEDIITDPLTEITELAKHFELPTERLGEIASIVDPSRQDKYRKLQKIGVDLSFVEEATNG